MEYKLGQKVRDHDRKIIGKICNILNKEVHVEYLKFEGDIEPYFISYNEKEQNKLIEVIENNHKNNINLTLGDLRKAILKTNLPDNTLVIVEHTKTDNNNLIKINEDTAFEVDFKRTWSANNINDKYFGIYINY